MRTEATVPAATYISAAIPPDSIEHFVVLMTAAQLRPIVAASIALARVIENIPRQSREPQIVQLKLNWWLEEVEMIAKNKPRHPLSIEIASQLQDDAWLEPLHALIRNTLSDISRPVFATLSEFLSHCHHAAQRQALMASVLPQCDKTALAYAGNSGVGICIVENLYHRSTTRLPATGLDSLTADETTRQLAVLADEHFMAAGTLPGAQRPPQSAVILQARLYRRLLHRLRQHDYDSDRATIHPLRQLWHAWREGRTLIR